MPSNPGVQGAEPLCLLHSVSWFLFVLAITVAAVLPAIPPFGRVIVVFMFIVLYSGSLICCPSCTKIRSV